MLILRIRQAEVALNDGRLDESFEIARSQRIRDHRRGQELIGKLARALAVRAKGHYMADRPQQALMDCDKASQLAGNLPEVAEVRAAAAEAMTAEQKRQLHAAQAVDAARKQIEQGHLAAGERLLADTAVNDVQPTRAALMKDDVLARRAILDSAIVGATAAVDRDDPDSALADLARGRAADPSDRRLKELSIQLAASLRQRISTAINDGRLDLAQSLCDRLDPIDTGLDREHLARALDQYRAARAAIDDGDPREAEKIIRRMVPIFPDARWLPAAAAQLKQLGQTLEDLHAGPLGMLASRSTVFQPVISLPQKPPVVEARAAAERTLLPSRFMLQVDGAGCFLVLRSANLGIGPVGSSRLPDVALVTEPATPFVNIERAEEDYFARGPAATVNDRPAGAGALLHSGDRVSLSPRCQFTFLLPNPASTSAALDFNGCRFPRGEVRRAVLLDRDLVIGSGPAAHVRVDSLPEPIILHLRDGRLFCESKQPLTVDGRAIDRQSGILTGQHVKVGELSFVITA